jgi:hypothetical protein
MGIAFRSWNDQTLISFRKNLHEKFNDKGLRMLKYEFHHVIFFRSLSLLLINKMVDFDEGTDFLHILIWGLFFCELSFVFINHWLWLYEFQIRQTLISYCTIIFLYVRMMLLLILKFVRVIKCLLVKGIRYTF